MATNIYTKSLEALFGNPSPYSLKAGDVNASDITSYLGTPVFTSIELNDGSNSIFLETVVVDIAQTRNIVSTSVQGRNGSIKEFISDTDYAVTIKGVFASKGTYSYPKAEVNKLLAICKAPKSVKVISDFLLIFGIHELVIKSYSIGQGEKSGYRNVQTFTLTCESDIPYELNIDSEK